METEKTSAATYAAASCCNISMEPKEEDLTSLAFNVFRLLLKEFPALVKLSHKSASFHF